jgi:hypothetical protein
MADTMRSLTRSWARGGGGPRLAVTVSPYGPPPPTTSEVSMSRYSIPAQQPGLTVTVGWDNPLCTLFAQVFDPSIEEDADACLLWIGTAPEAIPTVAALQAQLAGWATIPPDIVDRLLRDQHAATPPTPLQRWAHQLLHNVGKPRADRA